MARNACGVRRVSCGVWRVPSQLVGQSASRPLGRANSDLHWAGLQNNTFQLRTNQIGRPNWPPPKLVGGGGGAIKTARQEKRREEKRRSGEKSSGERPLSWAAQAAG